MTVSARPTITAMTPRGKSSTSLYLFLVLLAMLCVLPAIQAATEAKDVASSSQRFTCAGRSSGYYADVHSDCQKYYMCDSSGRLYSYTCPNQTRFQQRVMICDHWFMVDCSLSANYFSSNQNIGVQGRPFIAGHEQPRRPSQRRPVPTTTPYPWRRATSFTPGEPLPKASLAKKPIEEKTSKSPVIKNENNAVTKKDNKYFTPSVEIKQERTLPKEYANNPFFRGLTAATSEAPKLSFNKGHREVLTSPLRKDQANVFDKIPDGNNIYFTSTSPALETTTVATFSLSTDHKSNTFSTPLRKPLANIQETTSETFIAKSPLTSRQSFVTPRGHFDQHQDRLRNSFPVRFTEYDVEPPSTVAYEERPEDGFLLTKDLTSHDEELLTNTVELRIPDPRHMFYIADTPTLEAEMLNTNNETVLTIELPSVRHPGAMKFKGTRDAKGRRDACPQCHPAFLLPGRCQPCVLIRR